MPQEPRSDPAHPGPVPEAAFVEAYRRAGRAEARIRGAVIEDPAAHAAHLARRFTAFDRSRHLAQSRLTRIKSAYSHLLYTIAAADGWICVCGKNLKPMTRKYSSQRIRLAAPAEATRTRPAAAANGPRHDPETLAVRLGPSPGPDTHAE